MTPCLGEYCSSGTQGAPAGQAQRVGPQSHLDSPAPAAPSPALQGGLDAAGEASGVVLMGDRLSQVLDALGLGRAVLGKIRQNLAWALGYNVVGIPLAAGAEQRGRGAGNTVSRTRGGGGSGAGGAGGGGWGRRGMSI